jgi:hypothetical protein
MPIPSSGYHQAPAHEYSFEYLPVKHAEKYAIRKQNIRRHVT